MGLLVHFIIWIMKDDEPHCVSVHLHNEPQREYQCGLMNL